MLVVVSVALTVTGAALFVACAFASGQEANAALQLLEELALALFVTGCVGIGAHFIAAAAVEDAARKEITGRLRELREGIECASQNIGQLCHDVEDTRKQVIQLEDLFRNAVAAQVSNVYKDRQAATQRIRQLLTEAARKGEQVFLQGFALTSFFDTQGLFHQDVCALLGQTDQPCVRLSDAEGMEKWLYVLVSDPYSLDIAATAPFLDPVRDPKPHSDTHLYGKVQFSVRVLAAWQEAEQLKQRLEARLCRGPMSFKALITPSAALVQPYHLGFTPQEQTLELPLYELLPGSPGYIAAKQHFLNLWSSPHLSVPLSVVLKGEEVGVVVGAWEAGLCNLYSNRAQAHRRISYLLEQAKAARVAPPADTVPEEVRKEEEERRAIWLVGVSLRDFFSAAHHRHYDLLEDVLKTAKEAGWTPERPFVRALVVNPLGLQAMLRAMRESCPRDKPDDYFEPISAATMFASQLYRDVKDAITTVTQWRNQGLPIELRLYIASISCFLAVVPFPVGWEWQQRLLVEQYHYAKPFQNVSGGQAPVLEFTGGSELGRQLIGHSKFLWAISKSQTAETMAGVLANHDECARRWEELARDPYAPRPTE
jgi:hypothetical protein